MNGVSSTCLIKDCIPRYILHKHKQYLLWQNQELTGTKPYKPKALDGDLGTKQWKHKLAF